MLDMLSIEGMSDEEPGTETFGNRIIPVFRVKLCLWRAEAVSDYLRVIDSAGEDIRGRTRGAKTTPRIKTDMPGTSGAPTGLPRKMYDKEWLEQQERDCPFYVEEELRVSEEAFELLVLATENL